jgi:WD40 repeat protein
MRTRRAWLLAGTVLIVVASGTAWLLGKGDEATAITAVLTLSVAVLALAAQVFGVPWQHKQVANSRLAESERGAPGQVTKREAAPEDDSADSGSRAAVHSLILDPTIPQAAFVALHGPRWALASDGDCRAIASFGKFDSTIRIWDSEDAAVRETIRTQHRSGIDRAVMAKTNTFLATSCEEDSFFQIWDVVKGEEIATIPTPFEHSVGDIVFTSDASVMAVVSVPYHRTGSLAVYNLPDCSQRFLFEGIHSKAIDSISIARDTALVATTCRDDNWIVLCDLIAGSSRRLESELKADWPYGEKMKEFMGVAVPKNAELSPDGSIVAVSYWNTSVVEVWDTRTGTLKQTLETKHERCVDGTAIAAGGAFVVTMGRLDASVEVWDITKRRRWHDLRTVDIENRVNVFDWEIAPLHLLSLSPDDIRLAAANRNREQVFVFNPFTGRKTQLFDVGSPVYWMRFSADRQLTVASGNGLYRIRVI